MKHILRVAAFGLAGPLFVGACAPSGGDAPATQTPQESQASQAPQSQRASAATAAVSRDAVPHAQLPGTVEPTAYRIDLTIDPRQDGMSGIVEIDAQLPDPTDGFWVHAKTIDVSDASISIAGTDYPLSFDAVPLDEAPSGLAWLQAEETLPAGDALIRLDYSTPYNLSLNSAYKVVRDGEAYIVTQMEPLGAREAFPGFDEPRFKQPFTLSITAPSEDVVVSNTPLVSETDAGEGLIKHQFAQTRPLPTYLVAFAVGPYDIVDFGTLPPNEVRERPLELRGLAAKGEGPRLDYALENTDGLLSALEGYFGQEYPYEKLDLLAAPEYAFGAMENPGLIVYRESLLLLDENAPLSQRRGYARVHSHELAHQWFGNLVTPVWWEDIWLNEAFATWMGNKGLELWRPDGNFENVTLGASLGAMNIDSLSSTRRVREPLERSESVMDQFDGITYRKGGGVLDMMESYVGEEAFQRGVRLHMDRYADDVATANDFFQSIADGSENPDVVSAMKSFVDQPGLPIVQLGTRGGFTLEQSRYAPLGSTTDRYLQTWEIPVVMKIGAGDQIIERKVLLTAEDLNVDDLFDGIEPDWVMPNANGAGYYRFSLPKDDWAALIDNLDKLNTQEALSAQDSLVAAFRAGEADAQTFLAGMKAFAAHTAYDVASGSTPLLGFVYSEFPELRDGLAAHVSDTYARRYRDVRGADTVEGALLAPQLGALLARVGKDQEARNYLVRQGSLYLGLDGDGAARRGEVPTNILRSAFEETMRARADAAFEPLLELAANGSPLEKGAAVPALGSTTDAAQGERLRALALSEDSPLTGRQSLSLVSRLLGNEAQRDATWAWFTANFDDFVTRKVPDVRRGTLPNVAGVYCSAEGARTVEALFTDKASLVPGYERSLAQTLERIELCAALKDAQGDSLRAALGN